MNIQTILVPVDFSDCSPALVADAVSLACKMNAQLVLLNVVEPPPGASASMVDALTEDAALRLEGVGTAGIPTTRMTWRGTPVQAILDATERVGADLVMMGTHGRKGVAHLVLGSVAERVVRTSSVPVLTVRSIHRPGCDAGSCSWCLVKPDDVQQQARVEAEG